MRDLSPPLEFYRDVPIHDQQPRERIEGTVKPQIDRVLDGLHGVSELYAFVCNILNAPESRQLAAAKLEPCWEQAVAERLQRPADLSMETIQAWQAMLRGPRSATHYATLYETWPPPVLGGTPAVKREVPLVFEE
jgi:hypothetical protein